MLLLCRFDPFLWGVLEPEVVVRQVLVLLVLQALVCIVVIVFMDRIYDHLWFHIYYELLPFE